MNSGVKTCSLLALLVILVWTGQSASAQSRTESALVLNLRNYGWEAPDRMDHSGPLIAVDHKGRVLVGFTVRGRTGLVTRTKPSLDFRIMRFVPDGKPDLSLSLPTNVKGTTGIYLSDTDQIIARANEALQLLQTDERSPQGGTWKVLAPCALHCYVEQSVTRRTLHLYAYDADPPSTLIRFSPRPLQKQCGKTEKLIADKDDKIQNYPQSITDEFAYFSLDGDTYRWPLCDYEHRVEMPLHIHGRWIAVSDRFFVSNTSTVRTGKEGLEVISSDGRVKFRPELAEHEWAFSYPAIRSSDRGDRIAVDVVTMRGGISALDIGKHPTARRIAVYDVEAGKELASIGAHVKYTHGFEFDLSPDGHRLAILEDETVRLFNLDDAPMPKMH